MVTQFAIIANTAVVKVVMNVEQVIPLTTAAVKMNF